MRTLFLFIALLCFGISTVSAGEKPAATAAQEVAAPIQLNSASATELTALKGVGPKTAAAIVQWRDAHGPFESADQLLAVKGIGEKTLEGFRHQLAL